MLLWVCFQGQRQPLGLASLSSPLQSFLPFFNCVLSQSCGICSPCLICLLPLLQFLRFFPRYFSRCSVLFKSKFYGFLFILFMSMCTLVCAYAVARVWKPEHRGGPGTQLVFERGSSALTCSTILLPQFSCFFTTTKLLMQGKIKL